MRQNEWYNSGRKLKAWHIKNLSLISLFNLTNENPRCYSHPQMKNQTYNYNQQRSDMIERKLERQNRQDSYKRILLNITIYRIVYNNCCSNMKKSCQLQSCIGTVQLRWVSLTTSNCWFVHLPNRSCSSLILHVVSNLSNSA